MALPAVRNLKTMIVDDELTVAAPEKLAALWEKCPFVDKVVALEKPKNLRHTARQLREGKYGSTILFPNSLRTAAEAWHAGIPQRIGYALDGRRLLLTHPLPPPERNPARLHQRYYYLDLVTAIGGPSDASLPKLRKDPTTVAGRARAGARGLSRRRIWPGQALAGGQFRRGGAAFYRDAQGEDRAPRRAGR